MHAKPLHSQSGSTLTTKINTGPARDNVGIRSHLQFRICNINAFQNRLARISIKCKKKQKNQLNLPQKLVQVLSQSDWITDSNSFENIISVFNSASKLIITEIHQVNSDISVLFWILIIEHSWAFKLTFTIKFYNYFFHELFKQEIFQHIPLEAHKMYSLNEWVLFFLTAVNGLA